MKTFDETHTDSEFVQRLGDANQHWIDQVPRHEPDMAVDGLHRSILSRLTGLFERKTR